MDGTTFPALNRPDGAPATWPDDPAALLRALTVPDAPKGELPLWSAARFAGDYRKKDNVIDTGYLVLDFDCDPDNTDPMKRGDPDLDPDRLRALLSRALPPDTGWAAHTTPSSTPTAWRWRVVVPLARRVDREHFAALADRVAVPLMEAGSPAGEADEGWREAWRAWYCPTASAEVFEHPGDPLPVELDADAEELAEQRKAARGPLAAALKRRAELDRWHVGKATAALLRRAYPAGGAGAGCFPWPGCEPEWPDPGEGRAELPPGAVLVGTAGVQRADWRPLWQLAGPPAVDRVAVLVGATGRGKTAFAVQAAEAAAASGRPVVYLSAELGVEELAARLVAVRAGGDSTAGGRRWAAWRDVLHGRAPREATEDAAADLVADCPALYLCAPSSEGRTVDALRALVREAVRKHGAPPLVVVDYLQRLVETDGDARRTAVAAQSGELRALSRPDGDYPGAAVLALSSTARSNYNAVRGFFPLWRAASEDPDALVGMGKETGEIEYDASLVLVLTCDLDGDDAPDDNNADAGDTTNQADSRRAAGRRGVLAVAKNREGLTGTIRLDFDGARGVWSGARRLGRWKPKPPAEAGGGKPKRGGKKENYAAPPADPDAVFR